MVEPENLVLEQLRAIRGEIGKLMNEMQTMRVEMTAIRRHMAARIEKRLELADQS
jgi:regulator of replication initiation timing